MYCAAILASPTQYCQIHKDFPIGVHLKTEKAILAGGCFWGLQDLIRKHPGVLETHVGYTGGDIVHATYENHGSHAEGLKMIFDPSTLS